MNGTWAGIPRYIVRERLRARIDGRAARIDALRVQVEAVPDPAYEDALEVLRGRQDDDLDTLTQLGQEDT